MKLRRRFSDMVEHGIFTTRADLWIHFFPLCARACCYGVHDCLHHICSPPRKGEIDLRPSLIAARSRDGVSTGAGYLIDAHLDFVDTIECGTLPVEANWRRLTQRESGLLGESTVAKLIEVQRINLGAIIRKLAGRGAINTPSWTIESCRTANDQYDGIDFRARFHCSVGIEVKTETVEWTGNLFVQRKERDHRPNLAWGDAGAIVERVTEMPRLQ